MKELLISTNEQERFSSTVTARDWLQASQGFFLSTYIETRECVVLSDKSVFPHKGSEDHSNEISSSDVAHPAPDAITETMNAVCEELDTRLDPALAAIVHRRLAESEW
jgi:hypothetical protein